MSIRLNFMNAVIRKDIIDSGYPGGLAGFREQYAISQEDDYLVSLCSMSGGELEEIVDQLQAEGLDGRLIAVADGWGGPIEDGEGIRFQVAPGDGFPPVWMARDVRES